MGVGRGTGHSCGSLAPRPHTRPSACSTTDVHTVASLLKLYLRELPEPVVPFARYEDFLSCAQLLTKDEGEVSGSWGPILGGGPASWWRVCGDRTFCDSSRHTDPASCSVCVGGWCPGAACSVGGTGLEAPNLGRAGTSHCVCEGTLGRGAWNIPSLCAALCLSEGQVLPKAGRVPAVPLRTGSSGWATTQ